MTASSVDAADTTDRGDEATLMARVPGVAARHCSGMGGYSDITEGASVTITDGSGKTITLTHLEKGIYIDGVAGCLFAFQEKVPANLSVYGIEVPPRQRAVLQ